MESVIQEIATQLGMAASEVEGHVAELFPMAASAAAGKAIGAMVLCIGIMVLSLIGLARCFRKAFEDDDDDYSVVITIVSSLLLICSLVGACFVVPDGIAYIVSPEGATIVHFAEMMTK